MVLGKMVAILDWEWGRNSAPRDGQKSPWESIFFCIVGLPLFGKECFGTPVFKILVRALASEIGSCQSYLCHS